RGTPASPAYGEWFRRCPGWGRDDGPAFGPGRTLHPAAADAGRTGPPAWHGRRAAVRNPAPETGVAGALSATGQSPQRGRACVTGAGTRTLAGTRRQRT